jgi:ABC-type hemin transport system ATPase subunit
LEQTSITFFFAALDSVKMGRAAEKKKGRKKRRKKEKRENEIDR